MGRLRIGPYEQAARIYEAALPAGVDDRLGVAAVLSLAREIDWIEAHTTNVYENDNGSVDSIHPAALSHASVVAPPRASVALLSRRRPRRLAGARQRRCGYVGPRKGAHPWRISCSACSGRISCRTGIAIAGSRRSSVRVVSDGR